MAHTSVESYYKANWSMFDILNDIETISLLQAQMWHVVLIWHNTAKRNSFVL